MEAFSSKENKPNLEKEPGVLSWDQRKLLRSALLAAGVTLVAGSKLMDKEEEVTMEKPVPRVTQVEKDSSGSFLDRETLESFQERVDLSMCIEQGGSPEECLNPLSFQIKKYTDSLSESDINTTADRAKSAKMDKNFFVTESNFKKGLPEVPEKVQETLRELLLGWFAQESRFDNHAKSRSGAESYAQFKPHVYEEQMGTREVSKDINDNLDATGSLLADNNHYITHYAGEESLNTLKNQYGSEEDFLTKFVSFALLTAHNCGGPTMGREIKKFVDSVPVEDMERGIDLFPQFLEHSDLSEEAKQYAAMVMALDAALKERLAEIDNAEEADLYASLEDKKSDQRG